MYCECHQTLVFAFPTTARKMLPPAGSMPAPLQALASFFDNARRVWDNQWAELQQRAGPRPQGSPDQLVFHMMNPVQRRIVRMPRPFASLTAAGTDLPPLGSGGSQQGPPNLLRAAKGGSGTDGGASTHSAAEEKQERILISEVEIVGADPELEQIARNVLKTRPNFAYTINEVKQDVARVFSTGWFRECVPDAVDTRDGVKLIIKVTPNDVVRGMVATGANVLPNSIVQDAFKELYGKRLNYVAFKRAVQALDKWYSERGVLGQVTDYDIKDGVLTLECAEAVVSGITLEFIDPKTQEPAQKPRTRPEVILRHLSTQPGQVYNLKQAKRDIASIYATGLFEDVNLTPRESEASTETAPKVDLVLNVVERKTGGLGMGGGLSTQARTEGALPGFVGSFSYVERNLFGLNQKLSAVAELGQVDKIFKLQHTDPWILGDKHRTGRTIQVMNNRASGQAIHGPAEDQDRGSGTSPSPPPGSNSAVIIGRLISGVEYRRPLSAAWAGTLGLSWQRVTCLGDQGQLISRDCYDTPLTYSGKPADFMTVLATSATYNNPDDETSLLVSAESALPLQREWLRFIRLQARVDKPIPLIGPLTLHLRARGGLVHGDLPPYEAFPIGGTNSVRGYAEGGLGTGRQWAEGTAELRFPLVAPLSAQLFADAGTDFDSGSTVIGDPAGVRGKPGTGYAYGAGVRVDTPVGPLRLEYAWNAQRMGRFHVGVGYA